ncbi:MAG: EVE domain-containing protein [Candidatus Marinimicrobia bacterium]|nr:EVE domain-containing protein [Candidatus Neomarinimicrobiota bacterium]MCF7828346.1 EVE domain-containing protein [Candidatus Neomarinimicrobiota bacterium]MCF7881061.1 EVE domain-containing protein [Candidatus Neomarinimicrobiota bacterium]
MAQYWMIVSSKENFEATKVRDFSVQGVKSRHRKKAMEMQPGDKLMYYVTGIQKFAGITEVTSTFFEGEEIIWKSKKEGENYPWRIEIKPELILDEKDWVDSEVFKDKLQYIGKWPDKHWKLAFQGNVHSLPEEDYNTVKSILSDAAK